MGHAGSYPEKYIERPVSRHDFELGRMLDTLNFPLRTGCAGQGKAVSSQPRLNAGSGAMSARLQLYLLRIGEFL